MRREDGDLALARARIALRLGAAGPRTAARRTGPQLVGDPPRQAVLAAAEPGQADRVTGRAAACAHAGRIAAIVVANERAALVETIGEEARRFAVAHRTDLASLGPSQATASLAEDWTASRGRIAIGLRALAFGGEAVLSPREAACLDLALTAEEPS